MRADSMPTADAHAREMDAECEKAEQAIQKILDDLENDTGRRVDRVTVDTRPFVGLSVEIFFRRDQS